MKPDNILVIRNDSLVAATYLMNIDGVPTNITIPPGGDREFIMPNITMLKLQELGLRAT